MPPSRRTAPEATSAMTRLPLGLILIAVLASTAELTAQPAGPSTPLVNPFLVPLNPIDITPTGGTGDDGGGPGDSGNGDPGANTPGKRGIPGDAGVPPSGQGSAPGVRGSSQRGGSPQSATQRPGTGPRSISSGSGAGHFVDRWDNWWETNKFDFIELRRLDDTPISAQGRIAETPEERADRLSRVRELLRGQVTPVVRKLTSADDPAVRASAIVALGKLRSDGMVDQAVGMLQDGSFAVRRSAMLALGVLDDARASYLLMNIAADTPIGHKLLGRDSVGSEDRGTALLAVTLRDPGSARHLLTTLLEEPADLNSQVLATACSAAGLLGDARFLRSLSDIARDDDYPEYVRSSAATALGRLGEPAAVPVLVELLKGDQEPRRAAAAALGYVAHDGMSHVITALRHVLDEQNDAPTRHFAAISLGRLGGGAAREVLMEAFDDASSDMAPWLALGLGLCERGTPTGHVAPLLLNRALDENNAETRAAYLIALGLTRDPIALDLLEDELGRGKTLTAGQAAVALGLSGQDRALNPLRAAIRDETNPEILRQAALGLGILGHGAAIPDLLELIRETRNPFVAAFAALGLSLMGDEDAIGPLLSTIEREGPRGVTTTFATAAVGQLFDADRRPALSRLASGDNYLARADAINGLLALGF